MPKALLFQIGVKNQHVLYYIKWVQFLIVPNYYRQKKVPLWGHLTTRIWISYYSHFTITLE